MVSPLPLFFVVLLRGVGAVVTLVQEIVDDGERFGWSAAVTAGDLAVGAGSRVDTYELHASGQFRFRSSIAGADDGLGAAVDVSGETLVAGAPLSDRVATDGGAAFVYRLADDWVKAADVLPRTADLAAEFGEFVAVEDDVLVACTRNGRRADDDAEGTADVYRYYEGTSWNFEASLVRSGRATGRGVALSPPYAAVAGALGSDGKVEVWTTTTTLSGGGGGGQWDFAQEVGDSPDGADYEEFGTFDRLATDGTFLVVGATSTSLATPGAAFVYRLAPWSFVQKVLPPDSAGADEFGTVVRLRGDVLAVADGARTVYLYEYYQSTEQWTHADTIVLADAVRALDLSETHLVVGVDGRVFVYALSSTFAPTATYAPTLQDPTKAPTSTPSYSPTDAPSTSPLPTRRPTPKPTPPPTPSPTPRPTPSPTPRPTRRDSEDQDEDEDEDEGD